MDKEQRTPVFDAVRTYYSDKTIPFHVPGHKGGQGLPEFRAFVGQNTMGIDLTCMPDLDNICNPRGVIAEAEDLAARLYGADKAFFLVNGTTSGIQAMIMASCQPGDKIIIPRNAHKSALGGMILSGATPVYIHPEIHPEFGVSMGVTVENVTCALKQHPDAKAVLIVNPNYYGTTSNLREIVQAVHSFSVPVLVDEAHGAHFRFHDDLPVSAMEAGADLAASSSHKLLGSLTQSSLLLMRTGLMDPKRVKSTLNLTQTTSPSYLLLSSLDVARKQMAVGGKELMEKVLEITSWIRSQFQEIPGLRLFGQDLPGIPGCFAFDPTKITLNVQGLGMSGYETEYLLRSEFRIQVELSDLYNVMFLITVGDTWEKAEYLVESIRTIAGRHPGGNIIKLCPPLPRIPKVTASPREAFYSPTKTVDLIDSVGEISAEAVMAYPPGIPLICPGERITREVVDYINILKREKADLQGPDDAEIHQIRVLKGAKSLGAFERNISCRKN